MPAFKEDLVREWVRVAVLGQIEWTEPGFGGNVGGGDLEVNTRRFGRIPVELKWGVLGKGRYKGRQLCKLTVRPSQIRYHIMSAHARVKTAMLIGCNTIGVNVKMYLVAGIDCPTTGWLDMGYAYEAGIIVGGRVRRNMNQAVMMLPLLESDHFWRHYR